MSNRRAMTDGASLSVCMATYNGRRYLRRQLETILPQLGPRDELIVSDDASTDGTPELVREICGERVRLLHGTFRSPVLNFEQALKAASREVIVLADQDDVWCEHKLELVRGHFAGRDGERRLVLFDGRVIDEEERVLHDSIFALKNRAPASGATSTTVPIPAAAWRFRGSCWRSPCRSRKTS